MLQMVSYDERQHAQYQRGRHLPPHRLTRWFETFANYAQAGARLQCSISDRARAASRRHSLKHSADRSMVSSRHKRLRAIAESSTAHAAVAYLDGRAESIPLPAMSIDLVLMHLSFHHVRDRGAAAAKIARVLRADGRVLLRSTFSDRLPDLEWMRNFPRVREIEMQMFPSSRDVTRLFAAVGLQAIALVRSRNNFPRASRNMPHDCACARSRLSSTCRKRRSPRVLRGWTPRSPRKNSPGQLFGQAICLCSAGRTASRISCRTRQELVSTRRGPRQLPRSRARSRSTRRAGMD